MHITEYLKDTSKTHFSVEVIPPDKGSVAEILKTVEALKPYSPSFISVTAHPNIVEIEETTQGPVVHTKRRGINTHAVCWTLKEKYGIEVVPHIIGVGFTKQETEDALSDLHAFGIDNVFVVLGDQCTQAQGAKKPTEYAHAIDLVRQIADMNRGQFLDPKTEGEKTSFCMGVTGYPEGHPFSTNAEKDFDYLKEKIDAGASYIICNMFFDNHYFYAFKEQLAKKGVNVPVIPALKPIYQLKQLETIPERFNATIPSGLTRKLQKYSGKEQTFDRKRIGIDHCVDQAIQLIESEEACVHFYSMGRIEPLADIFAILRGEVAKQKYGLT